MLQQVFEQVNNDTVQTWLMRTRPPRNPGTIVPRDIEQAMQESLAKRRPEGLSFDDLYILDWWLAETSARLGLIKMVLEGNADIDIRHGGYDVTFYVDDSPVNIA
jgi:hypothetical protein